MSVALVFELIYHGTLAFSWVDIFGSFCCIFSTAHDKRGNGAWLMDWFFFSCITFSMLDARLGLLAGDFGWKHPFVVLWFDSTLLLSQA